MKKTLTLLTILGALTYSASAQTPKSCDLSLAASVNNGTINYRDTAKISFVLTNNGTAAMAVTDTVFYGVEGSTQAFRFVPTGPIASGASATFSNALRLIHDTLTNVDITEEYCFVLYNQSEITVGGVPYPVTYNDPNDANDRSCVTITLKKSTTSIFDLSGGTKQSMSLYPNPAKGVVSFKSTINAGSTVANVKDIAGRTILVKDFGKQVAGEKEFSLDISSLSEGMYYVELVNDGVRAIAKMNVQK